MAWSAEQRLTRLERIVMMFARAGARARRELNEKINVLIDAQIRSEDRMIKFDERFAKHEERFAKHEERFAKHEERFAKYDRRFEELGARMDKTLQILMTLVRDKQNGNSENLSPKH